ncbi:hypothetical protein P175DRAFT_043137 [Aspergillus ochraceoroseus IBT 24754]|uniref:Uncharacterized protein n=1 Tax=Aspergillus ochraceoroseus IBT 24754 TaxID=1392256 RepID=A0A2T5M7Y5_9EURO|nr:uncharacterized protein P175DRAFT_043137 [Aspergillus ochraceoroseus IBT 24754]PTU24644.1 hypothetical protein P175DRAFT_043137 [Aspergillus ochraceoroseus IBT 24754]
MFYFGTTWLLLMLKTPTLSVFTMSLNILYQVLHSIVTVYWIFLLPVIFLVYHVFPYAARTSTSGETAAQRATTFRPQNHNISPSTHPARVGRSLRHQLVPPARAGLNSDSAVDDVARQLEVLRTWISDNIMSGMYLYPKVLSYDSELARGRWFMRFQSHELTYLDKFQNFADTAAGRINIRLALLAMSVRPHSPMSPVYWAVALIPGLHLERYLLIYMPKQDIHGDLKAHFLDQRRRFVDTLRTRVKLVKILANRERMERGEQDRDHLRSCLTWISIMINQGAEPFRPVGDIRATWTDMRELKL